MKRSHINQLIRQASDCFAKHCWTLPPNPRWDVTDFGLNQYERYCLLLVNLAEEPEYCEKLMYARKGMTTLAHCHRKKKEDIISRWGTLRIQVWSGFPGKSDGEKFTVFVNNEPRSVISGESVTINSGERIRLVPGVYHEFVPVSEECIMGEVSTANDDLHDNFFANPDVGRFPGVDEDEPPFVKLLSDA